MASLVTLIVSVTLGAAMLWAGLAFSRWLGAYRVEHRRLWCPVHRTLASVDLLLDASGPEIYRDVLDCSLRPHGESLTCGKTCRSVSVAPFGTAT